MKIRLQFLVMALVIMPISVHAQDTLAGMLVDAGIKTSDLPNFGDLEKLFKVVQNAELFEKNSGLAASIKDLGAILADPENNLDRAEPLLQRMMSEMKGMLADADLPLPAGIQADPSPQVTAVLAQTEAALKQALLTAEAKFGPESAQLADSLDKLATFYYEQNRFKDAIPLLQRALAIDEKTTGPDSAQVASDLNNLGSFYYSAGKSKDAEPLLKRAIAIREKVLGQNHPDLAISCDNYALILRALGRNGEAAQFEKRAQTINAKPAVQTAKAK